jgi:hypothetical protein
MSMIVIMGMPYGIFRVIHGRVQGTGRDMIRGRPQMCGGQQSGPDDLPNLGLIGRQ